MAFFAKFTLSIFVIAFAWIEAHGLCLPEHPQKAFCRAKYVAKAKVISTDWEKDSQTTTRTPTTTKPPTTKPFFSLPKPADGETDWVEGRKPNELLLEIFKHGELPIEAVPIEPGMLPFMKPKIIRFELERLYRGTKYLSTTPGTQFSVQYSSMHKMPYQAGKTYLVTGFAYGKQLYTNDCNWFSEWDKLTNIQIYGLRRYYQIYCRCNIKFCPFNCKRTVYDCEWSPGRGKIGSEKIDFLSKNRVCMVKCGRCGWFDPMDRSKCRRG